MYITAHRVETNLEETGVNAFLHLHGEGFAWPEDPGPLTRDNPGRLALRRSEIPPGGNRVLSYLDVLAPDGTLAAEIDAALAELAAALDGKGNPTWYERGRLTLRFGVNPSIEQKGLAARLAELARLHAAATALHARLGEPEGAS